MCFGGKHPASAWKADLREGKNGMQRADSLEKTLMLGKIEGERRRGEGDDRG